MKRPKLLDLFCGAGGAGMGYHRAGFDVVGVDIKFQKRYPFEFHQADALEYLAGHGHEFDVIHASPPCQAEELTILANLHRHKKSYRDIHTNLIPDIRRLLVKIDKPYIIENVEGARDYLINPIMLCGTMFGLYTDFYKPLYRHRLFECNPAVWFPPAPCQHWNDRHAIGVHGGGQHPDRQDGTNGQYGIRQRQVAMGIYWMTGKELNQAIPPAYTEWLGKQILEASR